MSGQSITLLSKQKYAQEAEEILIYNSEQYFYHKHFKLSEGMNEEETTHNRHLLELLCDNNCEVYNALYGKIAGKTNYKNKKKSISHLIKEMWENDNHSHSDEFGRIAWTEKNW